MASHDRAGGLGSVRTGHGQGRDGEDKRQHKGEDAGETHGVLLDNGEANVMMHGVEPGVMSIGERAAGSSEGLLLGLILGSRGVRAPVPIGSALR